MNKFEDKLPPSAGEADETCHQSYQRNITDNTNLGGGFRYCLFSPLFGEDSYFDKRGWFNHQLEMLLPTCVFFHARKVGLPRLGHFRKKGRHPTGETIHYTNVW